jgi:eukaryotic-like serine/threonine-protein kinase
MPHNAPSNFASTSAESESSVAAHGAPGAYGHLGRYRLDRLIGQGAMGSVFEAYDPMLGRTLAIKTLLLEGVDASGGQDELSDAAILQEARAAATLNHPNIVTVYDAGRAQSQSLGREIPYVAMELLQGTDLRQHISRTRLSVRDAVSLVGKLALALDHAHKSGVLHRDIKPANVFMTQSGVPKILDFGLAKITARAKAGAQEGQTQEAAGGGSPKYMSPEHLRAMHDPSQVVDARSDVYSLGVLLYELLCGKAPFSAPTMALLQERIKLSRPATPHKVNTAVPRNLSELVMRALAKKPEDRFRSAGQFARELRRWGKDAFGINHEPDPPVTGAAALEGGIAKLSQSLKIASWRQQVLWATLLGVSVLATAWWIQASTQRTASTAQVTAQTLTNKKAVPAQPSVRPTGAATASPTATAAGNAAQAASSAAPTGFGRVRLAVSPWGEVEVDGRKEGVSPPLLSLNLSPGEHTIVVRNADFAARTFRVRVEADKTERVVHRFE